MSVTLRPAAERGHTRAGWLDSRHTFSFGDYHDPASPLTWGFRTLRVINDDRVSPAQGFGTHGHRDMEIVSYVLDGALEHKDSLGNGSVIRPGDVQRMSAGTGVRHSEFNPSRGEPVHFLQIWIVPARAALAPGYEQRHFDDGDLRNRLRLVAAPPSDGGAGDGAVTIHQDARIYAARLDPGVEVRHDLAPGRHAWVHVARGAATLGAHRVVAGDGAALSGEPAVVLRAADEPAEVLVFDLA